jgi:precorrin-2 methylase
MRDSVWEGATAARPTFAPPRSRRRVAFATLGDPNIPARFLRSRTVRAALGAPIETVAGIMAFRRWRLPGSSCSRES